MFSVLIATYNGSKYIIDQLESIVHQTISPDKIYIYDDCSTDNSLEIIRNWVQTNMIKNVIIRKNEKNKGYTHNFLEALFEIDDDFIFLSDQDDVWNKNKIELYMNTIKSIGTIEIPILLTSGYSITNQELNILRNIHVSHRLVDSILLPDLLKHYSYPGMTFCINRLLQKQAKENFNKKIVTYHDYFISLCAVKYGKMLCINESLVLYRQHGNNQLGVSGKKNKSRVYWNKIIQQYNACNAMSKYLFPDNLYVCDKTEFGNKRLENYEKKKFFSILFHLFSYMRFSNIKSYIADLYFSVFE